jgi:hypothetical protein
MIATLRADRGHRIVKSASTHNEQTSDRWQTALEAARRADTEERPHPDA